MNILQNQIGIFILAMFLIVATILFSVVSNFENNLYNATQSTYTSLGLTEATNQSTLFKSNTDSVVELLTTGVNLLLVLITVLTLYSSFISQNTISSYLLLFLASSIISSILIYAFHMIYNNFVVNTATIDIVNLNTFSNFIWTNFDTIILLNVVAFLLSFIFKIMENRNQYG